MILIEITIWQFVWQMQLNHLKGFYKQKRKEIAVEDESERLAVDIGHPLPPWPCWRQDRMAAQGVLLCVPEL